MNENEIKKIINQVVMDMTCIFTGWRQAAIPGEEAEWVNGYRRQLLAAIRESGISNLSEIEKGMSMARKSTSSFMPGVGQFAEWCKPKSKEASKAWQAVMKHLVSRGGSIPFKTDDSAATEAVRAIGGWHRLDRMLNIEIEAVKKEFSENYNETKADQLQLANEVKKLEH